MCLQVGVGNLLYELGQLQYQPHQSLVDSAADYWIVGVAVTAGTLLTVIVIILGVYKRKSTRAQRQFKRLQLQLDSLESNIRNECKQGQSVHRLICAATGTVRMTYRHLFWRHYAVSALFVVIMAYVAHFRGLTCRRNTKFLRS